MIFQNPNLTAAKFTLLLEMVGLEKSFPRSFFVRVFYQALLTLYKSLSQGQPGVLSKVSETGCQNSCRRAALRWWYSPRRNPFSRLFLGCFSTPPPHFSLFHWYFLIKLCSTWYIITHDPCLLLISTFLFVTRPYISLSFVPCCKMEPSFKLAFSKRWQIFNHKCTFFLLQANRS